MNQLTSIPVSDALFTTLEQVRDEHARLLDADSGDTPADRDYWLEVHRFATRVAQSGVYFDEPHEVKACQGYLSYWERELARVRVDKQFTDDLRVPELARYDETALRALQPSYPTNPFENFAAEVRALAAGGELASDRLAALIERKAEAAGLRFELDLPKEIANQVAGDPFAPTLLAFCLYHLFEDPETRIGNKLRRPLRGQGFGCVAFLASRAEQLYADQGKREKRVLIDALARFGLKDASRLPSAAMLAAEIDSVRDASSATFKGAAGRAMRLREFLSASRLAFESDRGLSIVHPALFRRWPELMSEIRLKEERERRRRRLTTYGIGAVAVLLVVGLVATWAWQWSADKEREANELATSSYSLPDDQPRISRALEAIAKWPTPRARIALNDAVAAMLGANAEAIVSGKASGKPLALIGRPASIEPCKAGGGRCFVDSQGRSVRLPGVDRTDVLYATNAPGTLVAVAWPAKRGKKPEKVRIAVYRIREQAELVGGVRETNCWGTVQQVRLSALGRTATLDCNPSGEDQDQPLWDLVRLADDAEQELLIAWPDLEGQRGLTHALYFGSPGMHGHAVLNDGGELETVSDAASDPNRTFHSNILRVVPRPDYIAFHPSRGFAALGAFDAPLVLVHEDSTGTGGRDDIYAVPAGLGSPWEVDYSPNGKCIEVRTKQPANAKKQGNVFAYHIVLDPDLLRDVARGLVGSTPTYQAPARCGFTQTVR
jgi:hypothetical protein